MIEADRLTKTYGYAGNVIPALQEVSLSIPSGQRVAIVGKSGSGKSTLLNMLAGLDRPTSGMLSVADQRLDQMSRNQMARYRGRCVGVVFQSFQLLPNQTAQKNVELPLILAGMAKQGRQEVAEGWLKRVGLAHRADHLPFALSGGEQQRVAIARAMAHRPDLLLADEPTGNLDSATAVQIEDLILQLCEETSATFVLVTHDEHMASRCSSRRFLMSDGSLAEAG